MPIASPQQSHRTSTLQSGADQLGQLCRGDRETVQKALASEQSGNICSCLVAITIGCALYGASLGLWRAPLQAAYVAIKLPILVGMTLLINGMLNGMLAQILGSGLTFRQTLHGCLLSFTIFALIAGSLSPILFFMVLNAPPASAPEAAQWHAIFLLVNVTVIAGAGIAGNVKLFVVLYAYSQDAIIALRVLLAWLAGNLFVGAQLAWILRPMMGNPTLDVQFLRDQPFDGNFYLDVLNKILLLFGTPSGASGTVALLILGIVTVIGVSCWRLLERGLRDTAPDTPRSKHTNPNQKS